MAHEDKTVCLLVGYDRRPGADVIRRRPDLSRRSAALRLEESGPLIWVPLSLPDDLDHPVSRLRRSRRCLASTAASSCSGSTLPPSSPPSSPRFSLLIRLERCFGPPRRYSRAIDVDSVFSPGLQIISALMVGVAAISAQGAVRMPEGFFLHGQETAANEIRTRLVGGEGPPLPLQGPSRQCAFSGVDLSDSDG